MKIEFHIKKYESFLRTAKKLDYSEDYETLIEDFLLAAAHLVNAALHKSGVLREDNDIKHNRLYGSLKAEHQLGEKTEEKFARAENMKKIAAALIKLKAEWQEAIILRYIEDYKLGEVSTIINKNPGAVRVMIHRALKALKREIDREGQSNSL